MSFISFRYLLVSLTCTDQGWSKIWGVRHCIQFPLPCKMFCYLLLLQAFFPIVSINTEDYVCYNSSTAPLRCIIVLPPPTRPNLLFISCDVSINSWLQDKIIFLWMSKTSQKTFPMCLLFFGSFLLHSHAAGFPEVTFPSLKKVGNFPRL